MVIPPTLISAFYDTETTGLLDPDHRLIEVHVDLYKGETLAKRKTWRINPERSISVEAQRVHGISLTDLYLSPRWPDVADEIAAWLNVGHIRVAHNAEFDEGFVAQELTRIGRPPLRNDRTVFDTMKGAPWATHNGKNPSLKELCFACGVPYDPALAHKADYDVDRMSRCFFNAVDWGFFQLPEMKIAA